MGQNVTNKTIEIPTCLVERPRQKAWWRGRDFICPVPHYPDPKVRDSKIALVMNSLFYCLDGNFDYAIRWQTCLDPPVARSSSLEWWGNDKLVTTVLLRDGNFQALLFNIDSNTMYRNTTMKGEPYRDLYIYEDRYPLVPCVNDDQCIVVDPYGHMIVYPGKNKKSLGRNIRVYNQYLITSNGKILLHVQKGNLSWLESINYKSLRKEMISKKYDCVYGITTGDCGTEPLVSGSNIICGFGSRLVCFDCDFNVIWEFSYPQIRSRDSGQPLTVTTPEGELIYQTSSEVNITSNLISDSEYLYFVISECTRHISFLTKMSLGDGKVIWTTRIDGYSGPFKIIETSSKGLLLQIDTMLWVIAQDGSIRKEARIQIDCAGCSNFVRLNENCFVIQADLGLHEAIIDIDKYFTDPIVETTGPNRSVFLSHASEDKNAIVKPFYEACERRSISAWYDAAEIRWGDSLIGKIEEGLRKSNIVILFMSRSFLEKPWTNRELEAAVTREINGQSVVLPLVLGLSHEELSDRHPIVASKLYRCIENFDPNNPVESEVIESLLDELERIM